MTMDLWIIYIYCLTTVVFSLSTDAQEVHTLISAKGYDGVPIIGRSAVPPNQWSSSGGSLDLNALKGNPDSMLFQKLGVHVAEGFVITSNGKQGDVERLSEAITGNASLSSVHGYTSVEIGGLVVDWTSNNIYWTDQVYKWVLLSPLNKGSNLHYTVIDKDLDKPGGIAVYPKTSKLFWTDYGANPKIESSSLDGNDRRAIVTTGLTSPRYLNIDHRTGTLYWVDTSNNLIGSCLVDGSDVTVLYQDSLLSSYVGFTIYGDLLIGINNERQELYRHDLSAPSAYTTTSMNIGEMYDIQIYAASEQPAIASPCQTATCSHICVNINDNAAFRCLCPDGKILIFGYMCVSNGYINGPLYIYTLSNSLCWYHVWTPVMTDEELSHSCFVSFSTPSQYYVGHLYSQRYIYVARSSGISRVLLKDGEGAKWLLQNVGDIKGFSIDWISLTMYWTNSEGIMLAASTGQHINKLLSMTQLNGLVVDPVHGYLYFTRISTSATGYIGKAYMDGKAVTSFVSGSIGRPEQLVVDYGDNRLYWADSLLDRLESIQLDGTDRKIVLNSANTHPFGLATFQNHLTWTDQTSGAPGLHWAYKDGTGDTIRSVLKTHTTGNIVLFGDYSQPTKHTSACTDNNGDCEHLCLPTPNGRTCSCGRGYTLEANNKTCKSVATLLDAGLVFIDRIQDGIFQLDPSNEVISAIPVSSLTAPVAIDIDPEDGLIFWTDVSLKTIRQSTLLGTDNIIIKQLPADAVPDGIAVDWKNKIIIYTDTGTDEIVKMDYNGGSDTTLISEVDEPRAIALDFSSRKIYWTDWGITPKIEAANYDGTSRRTVVSGVNMAWPNGLTIDRIVQVLYWCDGQLGRIESVNTDGSNRRLIHTDLGEHYFGVTLLNDYLYLTSWSNGHLQKIRKDGGIKETIGDRVLVKTFGIASYHRVVPTTTSTPTTTTSDKITTTMTSTTREQTTTETTTTTTTPEETTTNEIITSSVTVPTPDSTTKEATSTTLSNASDAPPGLEDKNAGTLSVDSTGGQASDIPTGTIITVALVIFAVIIITVCVTIGIYCCIKKRRASNDQLPHLQRRNDNPPPYSCTNDDFKPDDRPVSAIYNTIDDLVEFNGIPTADQQAYGYNRLATVTRMQGTPLTDNQTESPYVRLYETKTNTTPSDRRESEDYMKPYSDVPSLPPKVAKKRYQTE